MIFTHVYTPGSCNILQRIGHKTRHHIEACKGTEQTPSKHDLESLFVVEKLSFIIYCAEFFTVCPLFLIIILIITSIINFTTKERSNLHQ